MVHKDGDPRDFAKNDSVKNDLLSKLTGGQALEILRRLAAENGTISDAIIAKAKDVLAAVDVEDVAEDVFFQLDGIDVQDCWDRAGGHRDGYTSQEDAAEELVEEELQPFLDQVTQYRDLGMARQERDYCMGIILGIYRYEKESKSEFKDFCMDIPQDSADRLLDEWRKKNQEASAITSMDAFILQCCPDWANRMIRGS